VEIELMMRKRVDGDDDSMIPGKRKFMFHLKGTKVGID